MKTSILARSVLSLTLALAFSACNKPAERPSALSASLNGKVMQISDLSEITSSSAAGVYSSSGASNLSNLNSPKLKQLKMDATAQMVLDKVSNLSHKKAIEDQMGQGAVAFVVLRDQIKIMKVVNQLNTTDPNNRVESLSYVSKLKELSKTSDIQAQNKLQGDIQELAFMSPSEVNMKNGNNNEKFGLVEVTSIKVTKYGTLEDKRNDYGERTSIQDISPKPFEMSTHIVLGDEVGSDDSSASAPDLSSAPAQ